MNSCIFCQIANKTLPANLVYEDTDFMVFLDIHPRSPGHTLIIPKKHYAWVWDVEPQNAYWALANRTVQATRRAFGNEAVWCRVVGDEVPHAHIWIFPHPETSGAKNDLTGNLEKLKAAWI